MIVATTAYLSEYAEPSAAAATEWAENAVLYAGGQNWRFESFGNPPLSVVAVPYAQFAGAQCRSLSMDPNNPIPNPDNVNLSELPPNLILPGQHSTPAQVEARLRDLLGIDGWEVFGEVWYESLVNGLCIRR